MIIFPTKILLATDGSEEAQLALRMAVELANSTDSQLHLLTVGMLDLPGYVALLEEAYRNFERHGQQILDEQVKKVEEAGGIVAKAHFTMEGPPAQQIVKFAERLGVGLIMTGSRGLGGIRRALMGSVSDSVLRHAHCPVLVARGGVRDGEPVFSSRSILLATDGSEEAALAAKTAVDIANKSGSELQVAYVQPIPLSVSLSIDYDSDEVAISGATEDIRKEAQWFLDASLRQVEAGGGTVRRAHLRIGIRPDEEIVALAEEIGARLIVIGSRGMGGMRRTLLGSVSDSVVRHAHCPVLVVRK